MGLAKTFNYYYYEMADPRVKDWPLMGNLCPTLLILASYVYFVFECGPRFMKNRPAYELNTFIRLYNMFQITANAYIVYEILAVYPDAAALRCCTVDYSLNPDAIKIARIFYFFALLKIIDLIETGLFVLRKKNNQISFLHVYHHLSTVFYSMMFARYMAGGMSVFFVSMNSGIHAIMYSYYFFSNIEGIKEAIHPFKRYITIIQMVQFVFMLLHALIGLSPFCSITKVPVILMVPNILLNFSLFYYFYRKTYLDPKNAR
ncbi:elongation of very long chain fatty acids protein 7-like isoform X1 [Belonocnema kinseyi]|uniref:elongation of very long chain fatty acids protein 7-like isoform X1 n=1 Tax=Belonocnema kinseyi TaxID=2817044 RepID=UPI00143D3874|nr:elongation of very long chain fatty acids protein 7-like isoform X1 [Belonocnema kinseyi]